MSGNALKGEATVGDVDRLGGPNDVSKYNAIGIPGCVTTRGPAAMAAPRTTAITSSSSTVVEYAACPGGLYLNFIAEGALGPGDRRGGERPVGRQHATSPWCPAESTSRT